MNCQGFLDCKYGYYSICENGIWECKESFITAHPIIVPITLIVSSILSFLLIKYIISNNEHPL